MKICKDRLEQMVQNCIEWIVSGAEYTEAYEDLMAMGFDEDELKALGYGYIVNAAHEEYGDDEKEN